MSTPNTHLGAERIRKIMDACRNKEIFFLGAGGIMMSSLALLTHRAGYKTRGSDRGRSALTEKLEKAGIELDTVLRFRGTDPAVFVCKEK